MLSSYNYFNTAADGAVKSGPGGVHSATLAAGTDAATFTLYDNTAASGTVICKLSAAANTTESTVINITFGTGCFAEVTGTAPSASVSWW